MPRIAVDAMGSDAAPRVEVEGVVAAVRARRGIDVLLVGDEDRLRAELKTLGAEGPRISVLHAPEVITMDDSPSRAVKQKKKSSMRICFDLVKAGEADAVVSAGNSGAMMACGLFVLGRLPGVERPAVFGIERPDRFARLEGLHARRESLVTAPLRAEGVLSQRAEDDGGQSDDHECGNERNAFHHCPWPLTSRTSTP